MKTIRNKKVTFRLSEEEYDYLNDIVRQTFYSKEEYIRRKLIYGQQPLPNPYKNPDIDYKELIRQIRIIGYNLNQIAQKANSFGYINEIEYRKNIESLFSLIKPLRAIPMWVKENDCGVL